MSNEGASVLGCLAKVCSNNHGGECSTLGVNIGDVEPACDAFENNGIKSNPCVTTTRIGTCKIQNCYHNIAQKCTVKDILMVFQDNRALCSSYQSPWLNEYSL
jgi:hypothetical protein